MDGRADFPDRWGIGDDGARGTRSISIVEIRRIVNHGIEVVGSTTLTAETSSPREDGRVGQEDGSAVVCSGDGLGCHLVEVEAVGIPELRLKLGRVVGEGQWVDLAPGDKDLAIRQHDGVVKSAGKPHIVDPLHLRVGKGLANGDDVGIDGRCAALIVGSAPEGQDLAREGIVHDGVTVHRVTIVGTKAGAALGPLTIGAVPIHCTARASLEDGSALPSKEPSVVVGTEDTTVIVGQHGSDRAIGQRKPPTEVGVEYFTVLAPLPTRPGATDNEGLPVRDGALRLVAAADEHIGPTVPLIEGRIVYAHSLVVVSAGDEDASTPIQRQTRAEHVVVGVGDDALSDSLGKGVIAGRHGQTTVSAGEGAGLIRGPHHNSHGIMQQCDGHRH